MKRGGSSSVVLEAPDVLQKLGRPGFPHDLRVLLISNEAQERSEIAQQMLKLSYKVTAYESCSQATQQLASTVNVAFDIVLAEASLAAKGNKEGSLFMESISELPLVLISSPEGMTECVWRGIEVGAAEVLEKPLSTHKLQNIWQHVVRKVLDVKDSAVMLPSPFISSEGPEKADHQSVRSGKTPSSNMSTVTGQDCHMDNSYSVSPEVSADASVSQTSFSESLTVESSANDTQIKMEWMPSRTSKRPHELVGQGSTVANQARKAAKPGLRHTLSQPLTSQVKHANTVVGMVHPSWANSHGNSQAMRGSIPPGCVWGTPLNPPPGWQGTYSNGSGPLLGSAGNNTSLPRYNSAPVHKIESLSTSLEGFDSLADLDTNLMGNFGEDLFLGDDFLECEDSFLTSLSNPPSMSNTTPELGLEAPPIGLSLKKSDSLVDLINRHLTQSHLKTVSIGT